MRILYQFSSNFYRAEINPEFLTTLEDDDIREACGCAQAQEMMP
jgi:hypothetical protein